jgi:LCP family protein required for cell wall assembly
MTVSYDQSLPPRTAKQPPQRAPKAVPPKKRGRAGRVVFSFLALIILVLAVYAGYLYVKAKGTLNSIADPTAASVPSSERAQVKPIGLLLLGLDTRDEAQSMNTDVMMAAVFNPKSKTATVVSIPRDSLLGLPGYKRQKANAYYAGFLRTARVQEKLTGDETKKYARDKMKGMASEFFGVPIDYSSVLDFQGFIDVVDALGGVNVYVDQNMRYWDKADGTDIDLTKGDQKLDGEAALGFVRYRKSKNGETPESSDFARNDRQDRVLGAIVDKIKSLGSVTKVGGIFDAVGNNVRTDIPETQIENMIKTYFGISKDHIRFIALTGEWKSPYVQLDEAKLEEAKRALREELQPEGRPVGTSAESASPSASNG